MPESDALALTEVGGFPWVGLLLVATGIALLPVATHAVRTLVPERRVFFARWGFSHVVLAVFAWFSTLLALGLAFRLLGIQAEDDISALGQLLLNSATLLVPCLLVWRVAERCEVIGWRALGFPGGRDLQALSAATIAYVFILPVLLGLLTIWPYLLEFLGQEFEAQAVMTTLFELASFEVVVGLLIAIAIQPFLEEVLFRGFLQPLLVQNLSDRGGVIATSILFALMHGSSAFLPVFVLSLVIGAVMLRTQRLSAAWLVHALNNATAMVLATYAETAEGTSGL